MALIFDIETMALSDEDLAAVKPEFEAPSNWKDTVKIAEKLAEQEAKWKQRAALDATTGKVLVIGLLDGERFNPITCATEAEILTLFWGTLEQYVQRGEVISGFYIFGFDLPFLIRRSWRLGVRVPLGIREGRYWHKLFVDVAEMWTCGNRDQTINLDTLAKCLGVGAKTGKGEDFGALWILDRQKAINYLRNDLVLTKACFDRMWGNFKPSV